jgi:nucleoside-diphosphate-sugar epimerase
MARRRILVCGATGFIGRNLAIALSGRSDLEVHAVRHTRPAYDLPGVTWHRADLRNAAAVEALVSGMDVVVQAAATTSGAGDIVAQPHIHVTDNAVMNALRACHDRGVGHFVFFSCSVMYPSGDASVAEDDWHPGIEMHPRYFGAGWTKVYVEQMCAFYARLGVTRHTVIRHSNVYGPHDKFDLARSHVFGATVTKVMTATDGRLTVWGDGREARDLMHVDDLVDFVQRAIDVRTDPFGLYNVGSGEAVPVGDLVRRIVAASGRPLEVVHDLSRPTIPTTVRLDCNRAERTFGWRPSVSLDDGIRQTLDWWRKARASGALA